MSKIIIDATLTTVQPVSIKLPDQDGHPKMTRGVDSEGHPKKTAYSPATTARSSAAPPWVFATIWCGLSGVAAYALWATPRGAAIPLLVRVIFGIEEPTLETVSLVSQAMALLEQVRRVVDRAAKLVPVSNANS